MVKTRKKTRKTARKKTKSRKAVKRKATRKTKKTKSRKSAVKRKKTTKKKARRKSGRKSGLAQKAYSVSPELQEIVKAKQLTRPQIVKKLWEYIKRHGCQDSKNRRMIVPDAKLAKVLGNRPIDMLKIASALNKHIGK